MNRTSIAKLFKAIEAGDVTIVTAQLDADPAVIDVQGEGSPVWRDKTPLMFAIQCGHHYIARQLIRRGADVGARMSGGPRSAVIALAVRSVIPQQGMQDVVRLVGDLIDAGADPNDALWPALSAYNKAWDRPEVIELLLQRGADPDRPVGNSGNTVRELVAINAGRYSARVLSLFGV